MKLTIEVTTKTDSVVIAVPAVVDNGFTVVKGVEVYEDSILGLDGIEYPLSQIDEANWASAQHMYDNAVRQAAVYGDHYTDWL
jgi:hypothetical protein